MARTATVRELWPPVLFIAAADPSGAVDLAVFANYGVVGVVAIILIWFARGAHQRERDRSDRLEAEVQRLHEVMIERVIPALTSASRAAEESAALLAAMARERELARIVQQQRGLESDR